MLYDLRDITTKDELREEVKQLMKDGVIDVVGGLNGYLIKIINPDKLL